jgi:hypothetical protein
MGNTQLDAGHDAPVVTDLVQLKKLWPKLRIVEKPLCQVPGVVTRLDGDPLRSVIPASYRTRLTHITADNPVDNPNNCGLSHMPHAGHSPR